MKNKIHFYALMIGLMVTSQADAIVVFDPTVYAQVYQTVRLLTQQLSQLNTAVKEATRQKEILEQQQQTLGGWQHSWSNAETLINQMNNTMNQGNAISFQAQNLEARFNETFPGYVAPNNYDDQYKKMNTTTMDTLKNTMQSMSQNSNDIASEQSQLAFMQKQSQSANNQLKAVQVSNQIASEQVSQTQLLRHTVMSQTNAQATYYAERLQAEASAKAELSSVINKGKKDIPSFGSGGDVLHIPRLK